MDSGGIVQGVVVRLRSGGPNMTVESVDDQGKVHCVWFQAGKGRLECRAFVVAALECR
ncbi:DUF2158 domain-containing protein [Phreatobacter sp.]|uniref:DUF2158 domain-containing protein n=1 Tax=Phreatobacter sp. TaxID=1966341 RepID=UPI0034395067